MAEPLPKKLFDRAKALGVTSIELQFSGGSDEGHLYISLGTSAEAKVYGTNELNPDETYAGIYGNRRQELAEYWDGQGDADKATYLRNLNLLDDLEGDIDEWAWEVYEYGGAGDGNDYGDNIEYDLETMEVTTSGWHMVAHDCDSEFAGGDLEVVDDGMPAAGWEAFHDAV